MRTLFSKPSASVAFPAKPPIQQAKFPQLNHRSVYMLTEAEATELALELRVFA